MFDGPRPRPERVRLLLARPKLRINTSNQTETALEALRHLAPTGKYFVHGGRLVRLTPGDGAEPPTISMMNQYHVVNAVNGVCDVVGENAKGEEGRQKFSAFLANLMIAAAPDHLPEFRGFCSTPKLTPGGGIETRAGYDPNTGLVFYSVPRLNVPARPNRAEAREAWATLRCLFRTFCFGDAACNADGWVDLDQPPGSDESTALVALLAAISRPFLDRAPGTLVTAPSINGSGAGKGLLVSVICTIAYGAPPKVINASPKLGQFDEQLGATLMQAAPALSIDNANGLVPPSSLMDSILTEAQVLHRVLGKSEIVLLLSGVALFITGNGTTLQEDTLRRFCTIRFDPRMEDADERDFEFPDGELIKEVKRRRAEYLSAALTIWRWAQQNADAIPRGASIGSFEQWARWCRDPILALGGADPVVRAREDKASDPLRREWVETLKLWHAKHGTTPVLLREIDEEVWARIAPPPNSTSQRARRNLEAKVNTRIGGMVLKSEKPAKHSDTRYSVHFVDADAEPPSDTESPRTPEEERRRRADEVNRRASQKPEGGRR